MHDDEQQPDLFDDEPTDELIANLLKPVRCGMCEKPMPSR